MEATTAGSWIARARGLLDHLEAHESGHITEAVDLCTRAIADGGLVHLFGTGHSRIPIEEMFPRYGSYPGFHPIGELSMTFHTQIVGANGQRQAMFIERTQGLGEIILDNFTFQSSDVVMVFSASGRSAVPIEVASGAQQRGLSTVVVTSVAESMASAPTHPTGTRLLDHGDVVIDVGTPPGDALVDIPGLDTPVGPGSTLAYAAVINEIKVQVAERLVALDAMPAVITAASVAGEERSQELFAAAYDDHAHRYARAITPGERA